jgi:hypothetical protein
MRSLFVAAALCSLSLATAQHGPRFGLCLATQSTGALFQNTSNLLAGPLVGWHFEAPVHPQVSIMPEVLLMTKGFSVRNPAQNTRARSTFRYLEVPILAKVSLDASADGLYLLAGPSMGYFLSGRYQSWLEGREVSDIRYELSNANRRFEFSGVVGMGMEGPKWAFDVRAQTSITPFDRFVRIQNVVYALTLGYRIRRADADAGN